jgi:chaperone modulatory protein CbpM
MNRIGSVEHAVVVETDLQFSLSELSRICAADISTLEELVHEGILTPLDAHSTPWVFRGIDLVRARRALRLVLEMDLNAAGAALAIDLLDEIEALRSQLRNR